MLTRHTSFAVTHPGNVRMRNEDSILDLNKEGLWVVADGMGGHDSGDYASQTIVKHLNNFSRQHSLSESVDLIENLLIEANHEIRQHSYFSQLEQSKASGSTVVGLLIFENIGITFWVGDSRLYRFRDSLSRLTEDHSLVEEMVKLGQITAEEAETHPDSNVILNALGIHPTLYVDFDSFKISDNDIYLLCSDGLFKDMNEIKISSIVDHNQTGMHDLANDLLNSALETAGSDNISVVCIKTHLYQDVA